MYKHIICIFFFSALLFTTINVQAQEAITIGDLVTKGEEISAEEISKINETIIISDTLVGWDYNWVAVLNGSQAAYSNWSQGGVNTVSVAASTIFNALYRKDRYAYGFSTNLNYGQASVAEQGTRKTDDKIAVNNKFSYRFADERWNAFANVNFSTQFQEGFDFDAGEDGEDIQISEFFAPAYFSQIAGIGFVPADYFTAEAGLALKETFVLNDSLSTQYGLAAGDNFRLEPGFSLAAGFEKEILKNLRLVSTVETFTNLQRNIDRTDVTFANELIGKINYFLNMSFQFVAIYDDDFNNQAQIKQVLSAGVSLSIL